MEPSTLSIFTSMIDYKLSAEIDPSFPSCFWSWCLSQRLERAHQDVHTPTACCHPRISLCRTHRGCKQDRLSWTFNLDLPGHLVRGTQELTLSLTSLKSLLRSYLKCWGETEIWQSGTPKSGARCISYTQRPRAALFKYSNPGRYPSPRLWGADTLTL